MADSKMCELPMPSHPRDMTSIRICPSNPRAASDKNPFCGCPKQLEDCWDCQPPNLIETRILRPPQVCIKPPCNYTIPPMMCPNPPRQKPELLCNPLCFDWTVDAPGLNDSYGRYGLNWHDWKMEEITKSAFKPLGTGYVPTHPGYSKTAPPPNSPIYMAMQPLECYGAETPCRAEPFAKDVNYFRDWRCPASKLSRPWKPPCVKWATNQHL